MTPQKILILQESNTKSITEKLNGLGSGYECLVRTPSDSVLDEIRHEKIKLIMVEWTGSSSEMRDFLRDPEKVRSFVPRIAILSSSAHSAAIEPLLLKMDGIIRSPITSTVLHFMVEQLVKPAAERWTRKAPRVEVEMPIELFNATKTLQIAARIKNLSAGGMFVEVSAPVPGLRKDEEVYFRGTRVMDAAISGSGLIRWILSNDSFGFGVQFMNVDSSTRNRIEKLLPVEKTL